MAGAFDSFKSGFATYGKFKAILAIPFIIIIDVILILIGRSLIKTKHTESTTMTVTSVGLTTTTSTPTTTPTTTATPTVDPTTTATPTPTVTVTPTTGPGCARVVSSKNEISYNCIVTGTITVKGQIYTITDLQRSGLSSPVVVGNTFNVYYDPANPSDVTVQPVSSKTIGYVLIGLAVLITIGFIATTIFMFVSKDFAMVQGGVDAISVITRRGGSKRHF